MNSFWFAAGMLIAHVLGASLGWSIAFGIIIGELMGDEK
jgi:hypothetical protein